MRKTITVIFNAIAAITALLAGTASATTYPIAPPGASVTLSPVDFIQSVPDESPRLPNPNPVIGDNLGQHPGAFVTGAPDLGSFFVGVFGGPIDTTLPDAAIYLWETTGFGAGVSLTGPEIQLGFWDGTAFTPFGMSQPASYLATHVRAGTMEIRSSITPLSDFDISPGFSSPLNAVEIEVVDSSAHNQVTAVASNSVEANAVPEPSVGPLLSIGLIGLLGYHWQQRKLTRKRMPG
jgi:hypothetical protein